VQPSVDPGQLVALNALLEERSVTRAAHRLGITQSSMSHRLAQLRQMLGDPLLVRVGGSLVPTPRALAMARPLAEALRALATSVAPVERFDPSTSRFALTIAMPDPLATLLPHVVAALVDEAPRAEIRVTNIGPGLSTALAGDPPGIALTPARFVDDDIRSRSLGDLRFGVVGRREHPAMRRKLTTERWLAHAHVTVRVGNETTNVIEEELARRGLTRRVAIEVPSFLAGLLVVARSDYLMNVPLPLVDEAAALLGLRLREAPIPLPRIRFALAWHPRFQAEPAHQWARERVFAAIRPAFNVTA
jgi:DNA-binding transcriptional LysR family regulator